MILENSVSRAKTRSGDGIGGPFNVARPGAFGGWRPVGRSIHIRVEECRRSAESIPFQLFSSNQGVDSTSCHPEALGGLVDGDPIPNGCRQSHVLHAPSIASGSSVGNTLALAIHCRRGPV